MGLPGWGNVLGVIFDNFGSKAARRRNKINSLKREQNELKKLPYSAKRDTRLTVIASELKKLFDEANNA